LKKPAFSLAHFLGNVFFRDKFIVDYRIKVVYTLSNIKGEVMIPAEQDYSLREKKFVKTKVSLMQAFMSRLKTTRFANISIKEVCESVEVSEGTFYNYFPQKVDVVYYYKSLVSVKIAWEINRKKSELSPW